MPEIQFFGVSKFYDPNIIAVDDLNFTIHHGEYLSLLGPSGCGKTTTLRMLSGLISPSKGVIEWDGQPIQEIGPDQRSIGYVFQQFAIFPHLNVYENVAFGPKVKGFTSKDIEDIVERYLKLVGLTEMIYKMPGDLAAADLQRVGIARVLSTGARTLLLDEPMGALDFKIREHFQDELRRIVKELDLTAIHVTHDQSEAMAISDRIGVMKKGKMVQLGSPKELLYSPSQIFTAHFIGEADFFEGVIVDKMNATITVELIGDEVIIIPEIHPSPMKGDRVVIGIRREFFQVVPFNGNLVPKQNALTGKVVADRYLGEKIRTRIKLDYGRSLEIKRKPQEKPLKKGSEVIIKIPIGAAFLFKYPDVGLDEALSVT